MRAYRSMSVSPTGCMCVEGYHVDVSSIILLEYVGSRAACDPL